MNCKPGDIAVVVRSDSEQEVRNRLARAMRDMRKAYRALTQERNSPADIYYACVVGAAQARLGIALSHAKEGRYSVSRWYYSRPYEIRRMVPSTLREAGAVG